MVPSICTLNHTDNSFAFVSARQTRSGDALMVISRSIRLASATDIMQPPSCILIDVHVKCNLRVAHLEATRIYAADLWSTHGNHRHLALFGEMTSTATRVALAFSLVCAATSIVSVRAPAGDMASLPVEVTHAGRIVRADRGHTIERTFAVPPGAAQLDIDF